jgi:hypothetical protein
MNESLTPAEVAERRQFEQRQLVKAYHSTFSTSHGKKVLADLKAKFGFDVCEADSELTSDNVIARRSFAKRPLYHIERMLKTTLRETAKPNKALSANHHENATAGPNSQAGS